MEPFDIDDWGQEEATGDEMTCFFLGLGLGIIIGGAIAAFIAYAIW
jgi:hypothetical protein